MNIVGEVAFIVNVLLFQYERLFFVWKTWCFHAGLASRHVSTDGVTGRRSISFKQGMLVSFARNVSRVLSFHDGKQARSLANATADELLNAKGPAALHVP